jgi:hypothetical protein
VLTKVVVEENRNGGMWKGNIYSHKQGKKARIKVNKRSKKEVNAYISIKNAKLQPLLENKMSI